MMAKFIAATVPSAHAGQHCSCIFSLSLGWWPWLLLMHLNRRLKGVAAMQRSEGCRLCTGGDIHLGGHPHPQPGLSVSPTASAPKGCWQTGRRHPTWLQGMIKPIAAKILYSFSHVIAVSCVYPSLVLMSSCFVLFFLCCFSLYSLFPWIYLPECPGSGCAGQRHTSCDAGTVELAPC